MPIANKQTLFYQQLFKSQQIKSDNVTIRVKQQVKSISNEIREDEIDVSSSLAQNKSLQNLIGGFYTTDNKNKYIKTNNENIKSLNKIDLQKFINAIYGDL